MSAAVYQLTLSGLLAKRQDLLARAIDSPGAVTAVWKGAQDIDREIWRRVQSAFDRGDAKARADLNDLLGSR